jgi:hypothetical protein
MNRGKMHIIRTSQNAEIYTVIFEVNAFLQHLFMILLKTLILNGITKLSKSVLIVNTNFYIPGVLVE